MLPQAHERNLVMLMSTLPTAPQALRIVDLLGLRINNKGLKMHPTRSSEPSPRITEGLRDSMGAHYIFNTHGDKDRSWIQSQDLRVHPQLRETEALRIRKILDGHAPNSETPFGSDSVLISANINVLSS